MFAWWNKPLTTRPFAERSPEIVVYAVVEQVSRAGLIASGGLVGLALIVRLGSWLPVGFAVFGAAFVSNIVVTWLGSRRLPRSRFGLAPRLDPRLFVGAGTRGDLVIQVCALASLVAFIAAISGSDALLAHLGQDDRSRGLLILLLISCLMFSLSWLTSRGLTPVNVQKSRRSRR